jgi:tetratricopeptide (TPR) repeat protein/ferredoxin
VIEARRGPAPKMGATRRGRWRTGVLVLVHVLMAAHIIQWVVMGTTVSPVEPSESMNTLELGLVNAGAVLFALAILSTLVFGRFFCGWLCHVVALQDACAWLMNRMGIRPKPFRSRLLVFVPLALGFYMFIWPNFKRFLVAPLLESQGIAWPAWLRPVAPLNAWQSEMIVTDYWATFPAWYVAVPFLLICGFVTVYFLGAKGFCTYACPYGGLFAPADKVAPVRIRVTDACMHCGHCTSVCTSNVRVSEEVRDFGMVVDPGCMKCMDCVEACPSDALYLGFGAPALGAKPRDKESRALSKAKAAGRYDLTRGGEIGAAAVFLAVFLGTRGMMDQVPMLLAGGLAAIVTYLLIQSWWVLTRPHARLYGLILKQKGKVRPAGVGFVLVALVLAGVAAWGGQARYPRWRADMDYARATIPTGFMVRPEFAPGPVSLERAQRSTVWLARADSFRDGGRGWTLNAEHRTRQAYFLTVLGRFEEAADALERVVEEGRPGDALVAQLIRLRQAAAGGGEPGIGGVDESIADPIQRRALELHPRLHQTRLELATRAGMRGEDGGVWFEVADESLRSEIGFRFMELSYWNRAGEPDKVRELMPGVVGLAEADHNTAGWLADCAGVAMNLGDVGMTMDLIDRAMTARGVHPGVFFAAAEIAATTGDAARALEHIDQGLAMRGGDGVVSLSRAAGLLLRLRENERAMELYQRAAAESAQPFERAQIGQTLIRSGLGLQDRAMRDAGLAIMTAAAEDSGEPLVWHDLAVAAYQMNRFREAGDAIVRAAELAPASAELARRASEMSVQVGFPDRAAEWLAEAERRAASRP